MTAETMLAQARKDLGLTGRPNAVTRDYADRNGAEFLEAAWCDMAVTYWARQSGNAAAVLPEGDRAYTVWHAEDGKRLGRWYAGTTNNIREHALPGALVFFDWNGANSIGAIDHIGVVEVNLGDGRVQTIEGNTGDACKRRVRGPSVIAGFWNPDYSGQNWTEAIVNQLPTLKQGDQGDDVKTLHHLLLARDATGLDGAGDSVFGPVHAIAVRVLQQAAAIEVDAIVGPQTWSALLRVR